MRPATCPDHGHASLVNAGAPNVVRCVAGGSCGRAFEPCRACRGEGERHGVTCEHCWGDGWTQRERA